MIPRQRKRQKQTSRLMLRKQDHRDCIFQDTYHNAIWQKIKQGDEVIDKLVWLKYPQRCLYIRTRYSQSGSATTTSKGWIDLDREWICAKNDTGATGTDICKLQDYVVTTRTAYSDYVQWDITQDGCVHKSFSYYDGRYSIRRFGDNELIIFWMPSSRPTSTLNMNTYTIDEFSIDNIEVTRRNSVLPFDKRYFDWYYFGAIPNGCMVYMKNGSNNDVYKIEKDTYHSLIVTHLYSDNPEETFKPNLIGESLTRPIFFNNKYYCLNAYSEKVTISGQTRYVQEVVLQYSENCTAWDITRIRLTNEATSSAIPKAYMCVRNGRMFLYVFSTLNGTVYTTKLYEVIGTEAVEMELPSNVITIPVKSNVGKGTLENAPIEYIQLQLDSTAETTELSWHLKDAMSNNIVDGWGNIEFKDGELQDYVEEPFIMLVRNYGGGRDIHIYLDAELKPNIDNFAFISSSFSASNGQEKLMDGDYCYVGTDTESEVEI